MDWTTLISEILWIEEITEKELSTSLTTSVTQSAINRLKKGYTRAPSYNLGNELVRRHQKLKRQMNAAKSLA
jgi:hypothetical protein